MSGPAGSAISSICLTSYDISEGFRQNKAEDPRRQSDASLLAAPASALWHELVQERRSESCVHEKVAVPHSLATPSERALHDALDEVLGSRDVNSKLFGHWARRLSGAYNGGFLLETKHDPATNANVITVRTHVAGRRPGSTGITGSIWSLHKDQKNEDVSKPRSADRGGNHPGDSRPPSATLG